MAGMNCTIELHAQLWVIVDLHFSSIVLVSWYSLLFIPATVHNMLTSKCKISSLSDSDGDMI